MSIELNPERPGHTFRLGWQLSEENQESLIQVMKGNSDLFAWKPEDVKGIDPEIAVHRLNIKPGIMPSRRDAISASNKMRSSKKKWRNC